MSQVSVQSENSGNLPTYFVEEVEDQYYIDRDTPYRF